MLTFDAMRSRSWSAAVLGAAAVAFMVAATVRAQRSNSPNGRQDAFGYTLFDQTSGKCSSQFTDIRNTGSPVTFQATYALPGDPAAADDGGAVIALASPFEFYAQPITALVMSSNGYYAAAGALNLEDGRDFSNDAWLPAVPGYVPFVSGSPTYSAPGRFMAYHGDLLARAGSTAHTQYFATCPRASEAFGSEPCTILQWSSWGLAGSSDTFSFQIVLYHHSFETVTQIGPGDSSAGAHVTIGMQDFEARSGLLYAANTGGAVPAGTAVCFFEPRFPAGGPFTDLQADILGPVAPPAPGDVFTVTMGATNAGPSPATGTVLSLALPPGVSYQSDTCGGAFAGGSYAFGALSPQARVECGINLRLNAGAGDIVGSVAGFETDPNQLNNSATFSLTVTDDGDGVAGSVEDAYPGGDGSPPFAPGDGNGDGIPDSQQANVATLPMATGNGWITVELSGPCTTLQNVVAVTEAVAGGGQLDSAFAYPYGLVGFRIPCAQPNTAVVRIYYHGATSVPPTYRKFGPLIPGGSPALWYTFGGAVFGTTRGVPSVTLSLADGLQGDDTGVDGVIVDQGGPGQGGNAEAIPSLQTWGLTSLMILIAAAGAWVLLRRTS
jgi:uncharacterized repeat protein (TIGR01451 family)